MSWQSKCQYQVEWESREREVRVALLSCHWNHWRETKEQVKSQLSAGNNIVGIGDARCVGRPRTLDWPLKVLIGIRHIQTLPLLNARHKDSSFHSAP